jgi:hypothetical protein
MKQTPTPDTRARCHPRPGSPSRRSMNTQSSAPRRGRYQHISRPETALMPHRQDAMRVVPGRGMVVETSRIIIANGETVAICPVALDDLPTPSGCRALYATNSAAC